ncbi:MAG: hypothetical protein KC656_15425 [Myxococcales bacterium]|nr:hypothetical protein [Myxococcales bacterium]MCB9671784.1 hypothetical protein [Alphaproteobacteria bacterium]
MAPIALLALLGGCRVIDAPDNLEELMVFAFDGFEDERVMRASVDELLPLVDENLAELEDGYLIDQLTVEDLASIGVEVESTENITGAMGRVPYRHGVDDVMQVVTAENKDEIMDHIEAFEVVDQTDRECFFAHTCATYTQEVRETARVAILGASERHYTHTARWIDHPELGPIAAIRALSPEPIEFTSGLARVDQQYGLAFVVPEGDAAVRIEAFWVDAVALGIQLPDGFAVNTAVNQMANTAEMIDAILDGD